MRPEDVYDLIPRTYPKVNPVALAGFKVYNNNWLEFSRIAACYEDREMGDELRAKVDRSMRGDGRVIRHAVPWTGPCWKVLLVCAGTPAAI